MKCKHCNKKLDVIDLKKEKIFIIPNEYVGLVLEKLYDEGEFTFYIGNNACTYEGNRWYKGWEYTFDAPFDFKECCHDVIHTGQSKFNVALSIACEDVMREEPTNDFCKWFKKFKKDTQLLIDYYEVCKNYEPPCNKINDIGY